jgi:hypothetical protein
MLRIAFGFAGALAVLASPPTGLKAGNDLRVPTPPGVREPQNRRVEIVFPQ